MTEGAEASLWNNPRVAAVRLTCQLYDLMLVSLGTH
jgi:hypothetical protein